MRKEKKKVIIIITIIIVSIVTFFFTFKNILNKKQEPLPEVKLREMKNSKSFAIMVTNEAGDGYKEYKGDSWPGNEYVYSKAECVDNSGKKIENAITYEEETNTVILETEKTIYCTLYFDENNILKTLRENDPNKVISKNLVGDLYRYQGVRTKEGEDETHKIVDNNYLCFGTNNAGECKDNPEKYMYRIIGVTNKGSLKVIKMTGVEESGINTFLWNDTYYYDTTHGEESCPNGECPEWPNTLLFKRLNGLSKGSVSGSGFASSDKGNTDIFINNKNYSYMSEGNYWYNLIEDHNWMYGDMSIQENTIINGETIYGIRNDGLTLYKIETGKLPTRHRIDNNGTYEKCQWSKEDSVTAKIGLMYVHDYFLAYDNVTLWDYWTTNYASKQDNWLYTSQRTEWTMVRAERFLNTWQDLPNGLGIMTLPYPRGTISNYSGNKLFIARPVFYIKNEIELEGKGTESNPYIIPPQKNENNQIYYDYEYTGDIREFVAPEAGTYKLEVWGAQGGALGSAINVGGLGGYSVGEVTLKANDKLYVVVGGQGESYNGTGSAINRTYKGGFNGGGNGGSAETSLSQYALGGGGATHIAKVTGLLSTLNNQRGQILIVAGGGGGNGGSSPTAYGGSGGGFKGTNGINIVSPNTSYYGTGATQEKGGDDMKIPNGVGLGLFGQGGEYGKDPSSNYNYAAGAGGGGGFFGGGGSSRGHAGAGGGSGYIGNELLKNKVMYCYNCDEDGNTNTKTITTNKSSAEPLSNTPKQGNGFARITKIS